MLNPRDSPRRRKLTWLLLGLAAVALLATSVYRAATFPFTHDESLSFAIFTWDPGWAGTPNNHVLNTQLMRMSSKWFGSSELALRLPNLAAHGIYLFSICFILRRVRSTILLILGFVLTNLNLFVNDFFFLARGYGLAVGFAAASVACLLEADERRRTGRSPVRWVAGALLAGDLAVLSSYSLVAFYLALLAMIAWTLLWQPNRLALVSGAGRKALLFVLSTAAFLIPVGWHMWRLQTDGQLYFGGSSGFVDDTVRSLVESLLYVSSASFTVSLVTSAVVVSVIPLSIVAVLRRHDSPAFVLVTTVLWLTIAATIGPHVIFGVLFPTDRAALIFVPLYSLMLVFGFDASLTQSRSSIVRAGVMWLAAGTSVSALWLFAQRFDPHTCRNWGFDAHNKVVIEMIDRDRRQRYPGETIFLTNTWNLEPSLHFYQVRDHLEWLGPILRGKFGRPAHYVYVFRRDLIELPAAPRTILASFSDTDTVLLRVDR